MKRNIYCAACMVVAAVLAGPVLAQTAPPVLNPIGPQTVAEGANLNLAISATDADLTTPTLTTSTLPANATFVDNGNGTGTFDFNPDFTQAGPYNVTFYANDAVTPDIDSEIVTITVTNTNQAPVLAPIGPQTVAEGAALNLGVSATDADGTTPTLSTSTLPSNATFVDNGNGTGSFAFNPDFTQAGPYSVTFYAGDGVAIDSEIVAITVTNTNQAPVLAAIGPQTVAEGAALNLGVSATDADGTTPTLSTSTLPTNATFVDNGNGTGSFAFNPNFTQAGPYSVTFYAGDGIAIDSEIVAITVTNTNQAPVLAAIGPQTVAEGAALNLGVSATDADGTTPTLSTSTLPSNATFVDNGNGTGSFAFNPDFTQAGPYSVTFYAGDGVAIDSEIVAITVTNTNQAPVLAAIGPQTVAEGAALNLGVSATDADGTTPTLSTSPLPTNATFVDNGNGTGSFAFNPNFTQAGPYSVTFYAGDGIAIDSEIVAITVTDAGNQAPVLAPIGPQMVAEGAALNLGISATDADGTTPTLSTSTLPSNATFVDNGNGTGSFAFNPDFTQAGPYSVTFYAGDGIAIDSEIVAITVTNTNQAPVLAPIGPQTVAEGAALNLGVSATDPDGTLPLMYASTLPLNASYVDNGDGTGSFAFNPDFTQAGPYSVTFYASDGIATDSEIVAITVTDVNQAPVLAPIGPQTVVEGASLNLAVTATDADGTTPTLSTSALPTNATFVDNGNGTGSFVFNPNFTQLGIYDVTFYAGDGIATDSEVVAITVTEAGNQAPVLAPIGPQIVYENASLNLTATATDPDGTTPSLSALNLPVNASFVDNGNGTGSFAFNPSFTQAGIYNITFKAFDGALVDSEVVAVTVLNVNRPPVLLTIGPKSVTEGATLSFPVSASDPDGTSPVLSTSVLPAHAIFTNNGNGTGSFSFTPDFTQTGSYPVTFYASDGTDVDSELVTITVADAGNQAPVLAPIGPRSVIEGMLLTFNVSATDPDGTTPSFSVINLPVNATFIDNLNGTGTFSFTPDFTQHGVYGVTFIASDGALADSELILLTVNRIGNRAPLLAAVGPQVVNEDDTLTINLSATDPDGDSLIYSFTTKFPMTGLSLADNHDGTAVLTYMPNEVSAGVDTVRVFVTDNGQPRLSAVQAIEIVTIEVNQPPKINPVGPFTVKVGRVLRFTVTATDSSDQSGARITLTAAGVPANATFVDQGNNTGLFTFTPAPSQVGVLTVQILATDAGNPPMSAALNVQITVVATNRPPVLAMIGPKMVVEGQTLSFVVSAIDADGTIPALIAEGPNSGSPTLPRHASFVDNGNGTGTFTFTPNFVQVGLYGVTFIATDGMDNDKETVLIQVIEAGNQRPNLFFIGAKQVTEAQQLALRISGDDPDSTVPSFRADSLPHGAVFVDSGNGAASFTWVPGYTQAGEHRVLFMAFDGQLADTEIVVITVLDAGNQKPKLDPVANVVTTETKRIRFTVHASDPDSVVPILSTSPLPTGALFTDNGDYTGSFDWPTTYYSAGDYTIKFFATDADSALLVDSVSMHIVVADSNQFPFVFPEPFVQTQTVNEGSTLNFHLQGGDADSTIPKLSMLESIPNFVMIDSLNGFGVLHITPNHQQAGIYNIHFIARDADPRYPNDTTMTQAYKFTVVNVTVPPVLDSIGPKTVLEGGILLFAVNATDPNSSTPPSIFADNLPANATLTGSSVPKAFRFTPSYLQAGVYTVLFRAVAGTLADSEYVTITVQEAGNQAPYFVANNPDTQKVVIGNSIVNHIVAIDPELDPVTLTFLFPPANSVFVDSGNGHASMRFTPNSSQVGATYIFRYIARDDKLAADTLFNWIRVLAFMRGDANGDNHVDMADITFVVDYVFRSGRPPDVVEAADANFDGHVDLTDAIYLVNYIFRHGPPPTNP